MQTSSRTSDAGFTLTEVLIVLALIGLGATVVFPITQRALHDGKLDSTARLVVADLRTAQAYAQNGQNDAAWGVYISGGTVTLFQGDTYATRDTAYDQNDFYPSSFTVSGTIEFNFAKRTGESAGGTLTVTDPDGNSRSFTVSAQGMVSW